MRLRQISSYPNFWVCPNCGYEKNIPQKRVLIIHGWESNSKEHWFLEERERLEKIGYGVTVPDMPSIFHPKQEEWVQIIKDFNPDKNSILIGHSLGGVAILRYLEEMVNRVGKCILIATPIRKLKFKEIEGFFEPDFNWKKIKGSSEKFVVLNQTEDPWVNLQHGKDLAKHLGVGLILIEGNDHFDQIDFSLLEKNILD